MRGGCYRGIAAELFAAHRVQTARARMDVREFVSLYRSLGWATIRVQPLGKAPVGAWQARTDEVDAFIDGDNVGVRLGEPSGGLVDIDLDCDEAVALAPVFLPPTCTFGRGGQKRHWLYRCATITKKPPRTHVELRSTGGQTVFPGSMHETQQLIEWYDWQPQGPSSAAEGTLMAAFGRLCAAVIIARAWPGLSGQRHDTVLALAGALWHSGWTEQDARDLLLPAMELDGSGDSGHRAAAIADTWGADREGIYGWPTVRRLLGDADAGALERAVAWVPVERPAVTAEAEDADTRPEIDLSADELSVLNAVGDALVQRTGVHGLYRQGGAMVTVDGPSTAHRVAREICHAVRLVRQTQKARQPASVPMDLANKIAALPPDLAELVGRRGTPLLRADGSVAEVAGYDAPTRYWCDGWSDPRVQALSQAEAAAAAGRLLAFVSAGQWDAESDAFSWLAHVLTVAGRTALAGPVPATIYTAAAPGSGKTALARVAGVIGGRCGAFTSPNLRDDDELARRLDLYAMSPAIVLDNLRGVLRSEPLEAAITGGHLAVRRLYVGQVSIPWRTVLSVTSNGAEIGIDWARRTMPVRLTSRKLDAMRDVVEEAETRPDLTADAIGILSGWLRSGGVYDGVGMVGFSEWSRVVAGAVRWACGVDVAAVTREASADLVSAEEDGGPLIDLIVGWLAGRKEFEVRELFEAPTMMELRADFDDVKALARRLSRCADATRVLRKRKSHSRHLWRVENRG